MTRADDEARQKAAHDMVVALLPLLPRGWRAELGTGDWCTHTDLVREDGARLRCEVSPWRQAGRAVFHGVRPRHRNGNFASAGDMPKVTVSAARSPKQIAGELRRRLLPAFDLAHAAAAKAVSFEDDANEEARLVARRIAEDIGAVVAAPNGRNSDEVHLRRVPDAVARLRVQPAFESGIYSKDVRVSFEVHGLDPERAARVLQIIAEADAERVDGVRMATPTRVASPIEETESGEDGLTSSDHARMVIR